MKDQPRNKNPVAKYAKLFNRAKVIPDKKKDYVRNKLWRIENANL